MRGEYPSPISMGITCVELPPRARRIPHIILRHVPHIRTTSACAENTDAKPNANHESWNYLRVRGEYQLIVRYMMLPMELPPRARRILRNGLLGPAPSGTTSACAENTVVDHRPRRPRGNYLRVRGEYPPLIARARSNKELPPRARRIR